MSGLLAVAVAGRGLVDPDEPVFHADDEAVVRGSAAFETLRVYAGRPFMLARHVDRLRGSIAALALPPADDVEEIVALAVGASDPDCVLRLYRSSRTLVALTARLPPIPTELRLRTLDVGAVPELLAGVKSTSYALAFAARRDAQEHGADDVLFTASGTLLECATANIWVRRGRTLQTPKLGPRVLPGITREVVASLAPGAGYEVEETTVTLDGAEELFTSSSIMELVPVVDVDGTPIPRGEAAGTLQALLRKAALG